MSNRDALANALYGVGAGGPEASGELADRLEDFFEYIYLVIPIQQGEDRRYSTWYYEGGLEIGFFLDRADAEAFIARKVEEHLAKERAKFEELEEARKGDYERKVRQRSLQIREHRVLAREGLREPDQEPSPHGPFVRKTFDEEAALKSMWPHYEIEEVRAAKA